LGFDAATGIFFPSFGSLMLTTTFFTPLSGRHQEGILQVGRLAAEPPDPCDRDLASGRGVAGILDLPDDLPRHGRRERQGDEDGRENGETAAVDHRGRLL